MQNENIVPYVIRKSTYLEGSAKCSYGVAEITESNKLSIQKFIECEINRNGIRPISIFRVICKIPQVKETKNNSCPTFLNAKLYSKEVKCLRVCLKFRYDQIVFCKGKPVSYFLRYLKVSLSVLFVLFVGVFIWRKTYEIRVSFLYSKLS